MYVHMERTPRLSSASGVILICLGNVVQHFLWCSIFLSLDYALNFDFSRI